MLSVQVVSHPPLVTGRHLRVLRLQVGDPVGAHRKTVCMTTDAVAHDVDADGAKAHQPADHPGAGNARHFQRPAFIVLVVAALGGLLIGQQHPCPEVFLQLDVGTAGNRLDGRHLRLHAGDGHIQRQQRAGVGVAGGPSSCGVAAGVRQHRGDSALAGAVLAQGDGVIQPVGVAVAAV
ncbi:hypothetical protein D3C87_1594110 [compost metagenome]